MIKFFLLLGLTAPLAISDTLVFTWGDSVNGTVTFNDGRFLIAARFGDKEWNPEISPKDVAEVRFNSLNYNPGVPPETPIPRGGIIGKCQVVLRNGTTLEAGMLVAIDKSIHTSSKKSFEKEKVAALRMLHE